MANLYTAINQIIGLPTDTSGIRYYTNWSITATAGGGATWPLTIDRKVESIPPLFPDDPDDHYPGVYIDTMGGFPDAILMGQHYECTFSIRVFYVAKSSTNTRPKETAREMITKVTDNLMASSGLGLSWIDSFEWRGFDEDNEITRGLSVLLPDFYAAASRFIVKAGVTF